MRSEVFEIRYPNGDFEIAATQIHRLPTSGDRFRRNGQEWEVTRTEGGRPILVYVELAGSGAPTHRADETYEGLDESPTTP